MTKPLFRAKLLTLFPEMFPSMLGQSLAGTALEKGIWSLEAIQIRDYAVDKHRKVDDPPFGGGAGLVMKPDVLDAAIEAAKADFPTARVLYMSPRGRVLDQALAMELVAGDGAIILCGRYEGVDQRVLDKHAIEEISIGDFILSGGEPAALVLLDACVRLLPSVMGNSQTVDEESFSNGLLEYPHYTRPATWQGRDVPSVLLSGHHEKVATWRRQQSEAITQARRPDLWQKFLAAKADKKVK